MEISTDHFEILEQGLNQVVAKYPGTKEQYANGGKTPEQWMWDTLHIAEKVECSLPEGFVELELNDYLTKREIEEALSEILEEEY